MQTVEKLILDNLKTTLNSAPGFTSETVFKFSQMGHSYDVVPCMDIKFESSNLLRRVNNLSECDMTVSLDVISRDESTDTDGHILAIVGDIEAALMLDPGRAGLAQLTEIKSVETGPIIIGQPETEALITLSIIYRKQTKHPDKIN